MNKIDYGKLGVNESGILGVVTEKELGINNSGEKFYKGIIITSFEFIGQVTNNENITGMPWSGHVDKTFFVGKVDNVDLFLKHLKIRPEDLLYA